MKKKTHRMPRKKAGKSKKDVPQITLYEGHPSLKKPVAAPLPPKPAPLVEIPIGRCVEGATKIVVTRRRFEWLDIIAYPNTDALSFMSNDMDPMTVLFFLHDGVNSREIDGRLEGAHREADGRYVFTKIVVESDDPMAILQTVFALRKRLRSNFRDDKDEAPLMLLERPVNRDLRGALLLRPSSRK